MSLAGLVVPGLLGALILAGCPASDTAGGALDGGSGPPGPEAAATTDAGVAPVPELALAIRYEAADGGLVPIVFTPGARALIEPSSTLVVGANLGLRNHRVRVFDEADRAMASDDEAAPGPALDYRIRFPTPLKSGHKYTLVLDAQTGPTFADESGRAQPDQRLEFQVAGEREKPTPPPKKKSPPGKRRRR